LRNTAFIENSQNKPFPRGVARLALKRLVRLDDAAHAHLVFVVQYRRRVITRRAFAFLRLAMEDAAKDLDVTTVAAKADGDHPASGNRVSADAGALRDRPAAPAGRHQPGGAGGWRDRRSAAAT